MPASADVAAVELWATRLRCPQIHQPSRLTDNSSSGDPGTHSFRRRTLNIENGGSVILGTANSNNAVALSVGKRGSGAVTVDGSGSSLTTAGAAYFGRGGNALLEVENNAIVQIGTDPSGLSGLAIGLGSTSSGQPTGGSSTAIIESGGSLYSSQGIDVGGGGVTGTLTVNAGTVEAATRLLVGLGAVVSGTTEGGGGIVNIGPGGVLKIDGNGITASGTAGLALGTYEGSTATGAATGTVNVSGAGAFLNVGSNYVNIGNTGSAEMTVSLGGSVLAGTPRPMPPLLSATRLVQSAP